MNRFKYNDEVKLKYIAKLGEALGPLYLHLLEETVFLNSKWLQYRKIYAKSPERIGLLNKTAPYFFGILQAILWEDILLGLARLTDSVKSTGRTNLTIRALLSPISDSDPAFATKLDPIVNGAVASCEFVRDWRNRRLAHLDLDLVNEQANPLPDISRAKTQQAIDGIIRVLNLIEAHYFDAENSFEILAGGDAEAMVFYLNAGVFYSEREREYLKNGKDFERPPNV